MFRTAFCRLAFIVGCLALSKGTYAESYTAGEADCFVDTIGVNVHLHYTDTVYWDFLKLKTAIKKLGVRHIRDGLVYDGHPEYYQRHRQLAGERNQNHFYR